MLEHHGQTTGIPLEGKPLYYEHKKCIICTVSVTQTGGGFYEEYRPVYSLQRAIGGVLTGIVGDPTGGSRAAYRDKLC